MSKRAILIGIGITAGCVVFIMISIGSKIFTEADIPIQAMGAFFGAIVTAFITMFLLVGQSKAEELKERNVEVFKEKTARYKAFIETVWEVWEDRQIDLKEINDLLKLVTKDILLVTSEHTTKKILQKIEEISEYSVKGTITKEEQRKLQASVFDMINLLAAEMNLGGKIGKAATQTISNFGR